MPKILTKILGDKKEWKAMEARANVLPRDFRIVYREMKSYMWKLAPGDGRGVIAALKEVLGIFEATAAQGNRVLDVTGEDVAAFCHERLRGTSSSYLDRWRASLNRDVAQKLAE
ncbi:MAG: DUF1048 domain-containing protein [Jatrophihabitans sp.]